MGDAETEVVTVHVAPELGERILVSGRTGDRGGYGSCSSGARGADTRLR